MRQGSCGNRNRYGRGREELHPEESSPYQAAPERQVEQKHLGGGFWAMTGEEPKDFVTEKRPGPYAGVGPKGYKRPDERIFHDVAETFMDDADLDASHIELEVHDRVVVLKGTVPNRTMKRLAEDDACSVLGVEDVLNQLHIASRAGRAGGGQPE